MDGSGPERSLEVLDNGFTIVVEPSPESFLATAVLAVEAGSRYDPDGSEGLALLAASALRDGTREMCGEEVDRRVESLGALLESGAGHEMATFMLTCLPEHLIELIGVLCEISSRPAFSPDELELARDRQLADILEADDDPYRVCLREFLEAVYADHPRRHPVWGYVGTVSSLTSDDLRSYHRETYCGCNAVLTVAGGVSASDITRAAEARFGSWPRGESDTRALPTPKRQRDVRRRRATMDRAQMHVCIGNLGITRTDPRYHAVAVMDAILGDSVGFYSRLATRLREEEGLAYLIESDAVGSAGRDPGIFRVYTAVSPANLDTAVRCILEEIERMVSEPPSEEETALAISYLKGTRIFGTETTEQRAYRLLSAVRFGLGLDYEERYHDLVGGVTPADVHEAARAVLDPENYTIAVVGPDATARPD